MVFMLQCYCPLIIEMTQTQASPITGCFHIFPVCQICSGTGPLTAISSCFFPSSLSMTKIFSGCCNCSASSCFCHKVMEQSLSYQCEIRVAETWIHTPLFAFVISVSFTGSSSAFESKYIKGCLCYQMPEYTDGIHLTEKIFTIGYGHFMPSIWHLPEALLLFFFNSSLR